MSPKGTITGDKIEQNERHKKDHLESSRSTDGPLVSHDIIYSGVESENSDDVEGKILQIIQSSYPKPVMKKMRKLFLFIVHFGGEILHCNQKGNVVMKGQIPDPKSNILDLLEASVTDHVSDKPTGYKAFMEALHEINVPSNFFVSAANSGKWRQERREVGRWRPY